jgi:sugar/nucleoside kinase (ribokinase family)
MARILRFLRDAPSIGLIGQTALDTVTTAGGRRVERLGGAPLYARRALLAAGVEPVVVTRAPGLPDAVVLPSRSRLRSILDHRPDGLRQRLDEVGQPFSADELQRLAEDELRDCAWVLLGGQSAGDFPPEAICALSGRGHRVLLDGQGLSRGADAGPVRLRSFPAAAVRGVQALKLNREEADAFGSSRALAALGVPELLVTHGVAGVRVRSGGRWTAVPAGGRVFADPTGAGDSFCALDALERARGAGPVRAARLAVRGVDALYAAS